MNEPRWLTRRVVLYIHSKQIDEHGGDDGVRDPALLDSALSRPRNTYEYSDEATLPELAADYAFGITRNHPFIDGNKRTSLLSAYIFLELNDLVLEVEEMEAADMVIALSSGEVDRDTFAEWISTNVRP
ncbi:MAG: type II toxin-antitoxin system death-on-curing family toxin [Myxococcota bacterium]